MAVYIPEHLQWSTEMATINAMNAESATVELIVAIHCALNRTDVDFDGGLNLFDKLYKKLNNYYVLNWNVDEMKRQVRESSEPCEEYMTVLKSVLTEQFMETYGL